jgi:hypothetical protein
VVSVWTCFGENRNIFFVHKRPRHGHSQTSNQINFKTSSHHFTWEVLSSVWFFLKISSSSKTFITSQDLADIVIIVYPLGLSRAFATCNATTLDNFQCYIATLPARSQSSSGLTKSMTTDYRPLCHTYIIIATIAKSKLQALVVFFSHNHYINMLNKLRK